MCVTMGKASTRDAVVASAPYATDVDEGDYLPPLRLRLM